MRLPMLGRLQKRKRLLASSSIPWLPCLLGQARQAMIPTATSLAVVIWRLTRTTMKISGLAIHRSPGHAHLNNQAKLANLTQRLPRLLPLHRQLDLRNRRSRRTMLRRRRASPRGGCEDGFRKVKDQEDRSKPNLGRRARWYTTMTSNDGLSRVPRGRSPRHPSWPLLPELRPQVRARWCVRLGRREQCLPHPRPAICA